MNRKRWQSQIKLHKIYIGEFKAKKEQKIKTNQINYDYANDDPFGILTSKILLESSKDKSATWNGNDRRLSMEIFSLSKPVPLSPNASANLKKITNTSRRRAHSSTFQEATLISTSVFEDPAAALAGYKTLKQYQIPIETTASVQARKHVSLGCRYVKFAVGAYGSHFLNIMGIARSRIDSDHENHHNHHSLASHADIPIEHIIFSSFLKTEPSATHKADPVPVHYVVVDKVTKSVVVSLRGTLGLSDVITVLIA